MKLLAIVAVPLLLLVPAVAVGASSTRSTTAS